MNDPLIEELNNTLKGKKILFFADNKFRMGYTILGIIPEMSYYKLILDAKDANCYYPLCTDLLIKFLNYELIKPEALLNGYSSKLADELEEVLYD